MSSPRLLGRMLRRVSAGEKRLAWNDAAVAEASDALTLTSPSFRDGGPLPERHAGEGLGANVSPALTWSKVPKLAVEAVLVLEAPSTPTFRPYVHALAYGIDPFARALAEGRLSSERRWNDGIRLGRNSFRHTRYDGPSPLRGHGAHLYAFQLFVLDRRLTFAEAPTRRQLLDQMKGRVLVRARLQGTFER